MEESRRMHLLINAWLWIVFLFNMLLCGYYSFFTIKEPSYPTSLGLGVLAILALGCWLSSILIMKWNRIGVYLLIIFSILAVLINYLTVDLYYNMIFTAALGIITLPLLFIPSDGTITWKLLEDGWDYLHCRHLYQFFSVLTVIILGITAYSTISGLDGEDLSASSDNAVQSDNTATDVPEEVWNYYHSDNGKCIIGVPEGYKQSNIAEGQILGLARTDNDPAIFIMQEDINAVQASGITSLERYATAIVNANRNADDASGFDKTRETSYNDNSHLVAYNLTVGGIEIRYNLLATKDSTNYYYCMVFCLKELAEDLQPVIDAILNSFELINEEAVTE